MAAQPRASGARACCGTGPGGLEIWVSLELVVLLNPPNGPGKGWGAQTSGVAAAIWRRHSDVAGMTFLVPRWWGQLAVTQVLLGLPELSGTERGDSDSQGCPAGEHQDLGV